MRYIQISIILVISILILLPFMLTFFIRDIPSGLQPSLDYTEKIYSTNIVTQVFVAQENRLSGIGVSIKNPNLANKKELSIKVLDMNDQVLRTINKSGKTIADGDFVKIMFEPINDSKDKEYKLIFESSGSSLGEALEVFIDDSTQDVSFVSYYKPANFFSVFTNIVRGWFSKFSGDTAFFVFYVAMVLIGGMYLLIFNKNSKN